MVERSGRTAVVVIHGMGEQKPMETLRGFVEAAWSEDPAIGASPADREVWSKPDEVSGGFDLRRITTRRSEALGGRCDFFEYYWAHHMTGSTARAMVAWLKRLLVRERASVPDRLVPHWRFGNAAIQGLAALAALGAYGLLAALIILFSGALLFAEKPLIWLFLALLGLLGALAWLLVAAKRLMPTLVDFVGDAARYFSPLPENIAARNAIRQGGVELIAKLHDRRYDRIVVAAHSLGTVVAYDILYHAWARIGWSELRALHGEDAPARGKLEALEAAAGRLAAAGEDELPERRRDYRIAQREYATALGEPRGEDAPLWRVSDFVTMGSPLSKADVLIAYEEGEWQALKARREAPACPPQPDAPGSAAFSYARDDGVRVPHHAAVFGPTVWTNIYFENEWVVMGDVVAGQVAPRLGRGVIDVRLERGTPTIRHTHYWSKPAERPAPPWIRALRAALNLPMRPEAALWGGADEAVTIRGEAVPEAPPAAARAEGAAESGES